MQRTTTAGRGVARRRFLAGVAAGQLATASAARATGVEEEKMKVAVGSDHAGFSLKGAVVQLLRSWGYTVSDVGTQSVEPVDFPDITRKVCDEILAGRAQRGVVIGGTGAGACIAANKMPRIRAVLCHDTYSAHECVEHDDANVLCLGAWIVGSKLVEEILPAFLNAKFISTDADFQRRLRKVAEMEKR
jgi:ribose 5-phosphate isomerase B